MRSEPVSGRAWRTARRMATIPYPAPSAPSLALFARMVQSKAQSLPCPPRPSLSLLRRSGLCSPPKCPTSFALPVPSSLVLAGPRCMTLRRHPAHCTSGGGLPCGSTPRRPALSSVPARCGRLSRLWGTFLLLSHVRSFKPPGHTMCIRATCMNEVRAGFRTRMAHGTAHGNYPLPCPLCSLPRPLCAHGAEQSAVPPLSPSSLPLSAPAVRPLLAS